MDDVETIARKLIAIDSQSHVSNAPLAEFISDILTPFAADIERIEYTDPGGRHKVSLVARIGRGSGGLALSGHMDTVPGLGWDADPFEARVEDGRMYGLGAVDMKASHCSDTGCRRGIRRHRDSSAADLDIHYRRGDRHSRRSPHSR